MTGTVIHFNAPKGWGFVSNDDGGPDIFCHHTAILANGYRKLEKGQRVEFDIEIGAKGKPQAANVVVIEKAVA